MLACCLPVSRPLASCQRHWSLWRRASNTATKCSQNIAIFMIFFKGVRYLYLCIRVLTYICDLWIIFSWTRMIMQRVVKRILKHVNMICHLITSQRSVSWLRCQPVQFEFIDRVLVWYDSLFQYFMKKCQTDRIYICKLTFSTLCKEHKYLLLFFLQSPECANLLWLGNVPQIFN